MTAHCLDCEHLLDDAHQDRADGTCERCDDDAAVGTYAPCQTTPRKAPRTGDIHGDAWTARLRADHAKPGHTHDRAHLPQHQDHNDATHAGGPCPDDLPPGAEIDDDPDALAAELTTEYAAALERVRDRAQEARAGADRMRQLAQPEASTWRDCDHANGPSDPAERAAAGATMDRRYRAERDTYDDNRSPYRPDDRPYPILDAARAARLARPMIADALALLTTAELDRMTSRAWREAARAWSDQRAYRAGGPSPRPDTFPLDAILCRDAEEADAWYHALAHEQHERRHRHDPRRNGCCDELDSTPSDTATQQTRSTQP